MRSADILRLFWIVKQFASTPVTIQVDVGVAAAVWAVGEPVAYGASVGARPF